MGRQGDGQRDDLSVRLKHTDDFNKAVAAGLSAGQTRLQPHLAPPYPYLLVVVDEARRPS